MIRWSLVAGAVLLAAPLSSAPALSGELSDISALDPAGAEIVILGEVHDNPAHHVAQAQAVAAMRPAALVFEMMTPEQAAIAEAEGPGDPAALARALDWAESGWPDFALYHPILAAAPDAAIHGAAVPPDDLRRAMEAGAAAVWGPDAAAAGLGPLPAPEQTAREAAQAAAHCDALPEAMLPGMVEAQRLRDARFARTALRALEETGGPVAVITGNGHARTDRGMPRALARLAPGVDVLSLGQLESRPAAPPPFDVWRVTEPAERPDPCAAFDDRDG